jgi:hypothetical protein
MVIIKEYDCVFGFAVLLRDAVNHQVSNSPACFRTMTWRIGSWLSWDMVDRTMPVSRHRPRHKTCHNRCRPERASCSILLDASSPLRGNMTQHVAAHTHTIVMQLGQNYQSSVFL